MSQLTYTHVDGIATITIDNPPQNRMSFEVLDGLRDAVRDLSGRNDTRVVLIRAEGPDFGFGADIAPWLDLSEEEVAVRLRDAIEQTNALEDLPVPIVGAACGNIVESRRRICDGVDNTHGFLSGWWCAHAT